MNASSITDEQKLLDELLTEIIVQGQIHIYGAGAYMKKFNFTQDKLNSLLLKLQNSGFLYKQSDVISRPTPEGVTYINSGGFLGLIEKNLSQKREEELRRQVSESTLEQHIINKRVIRRSFVISVISIFISIIAIVVAICNTFINPAK